VGGEDEGPFLAGRGEEAVELGGRPWRRDRL